MAQKQKASKKTKVKAGFLKNKFDVVKTRVNAFLERRPHRSFRKTPRRDLPKYAPIPGYFAFTSQVLKTIKAHKKSFATFLFLYLFMSFILIGIGSQENYQTLTDSINTFGEDIIGGDIDTATQTMALFGAAITGGLSGTLSEAQQVYLFILGVITWLSVVWYLRQKLNNVDIRVRDALYNSGSPFIPTLMICFVIALQLIPGALGILVYAAAESSGILQGGVEAMMFAIVALLLVTLSLYWATSSFFATIIVTIPGTYPYNALKMAGDIVIGRRVSIMLRLLWIVLVLVVVWAVILIPVILLAGRIDIEWLPLVPVTIQVLGAISILFASTYIYLLYRKMIDEPATT